MKDKCKPVPFTRHLETPLAVDLLDYLSYRIKLKRNRATNALVREALAKANDLCHSLAYRIR